MWLAVNTTVTTRLCLRTALACVLAYPSIVAAIALVALLPLHPVDMALTTGLLIAFVLTALACWLVRAYRTLFFCGGILLVAAILITAMLLIGSSEIG